MQISRFEDIVAWQKAQELATLVYRDFSGVRDYAFKGQLCRAAVSISNNIAEGFERQSNKEFKQFLYIAKGSAAEVRSMLYIAYELRYIEAKTKDQLYILSEDICKLLSGFIKIL